MVPAPYYTPSTMRAPAYQLRFTWTGWPTKGGLFPISFEDAAWDQLDAEWERDGLRRLDTKWRPEAVRITFSAKPSVSPTRLAARAKGRLDHVGNRLAARLRFSRKVAVRTMGGPRTSDVLQYISAQINSRCYASETYAEYLKRFTVRDPGVDLAMPTHTKRGAYWYNLHLVLLVNRRYRELEQKYFGEVRDGAFRIARKNGHRLSTIAVVPDHVHMAIRGALECDPESIAFSYLNNLAHLAGRRPIWEPGYYVGTFGEYNMNAIRSRHEEV